jgi:hypothetical protein
LLLSKSHKTPLSSFALKFFILIKTSEDIEWFYLLIKLTFGFLQANTPSGPIYKKKLTF